MILSKIPLVWRTALIMLAFALMTLAAYVIGLRMERGPVMFPKFADTMGLFALYAAGRSLGEKLAGGGGILGAAKALFTAAKPEPQPGGTP